MHIVLVEPEIPGNTGNIARLCAATNSELHLVKPLGFSIEDKYLKRAGLDYWNLVKVHCHENFAEVLELYKGHNFYYNTTKAVRPFDSKHLTVVMTPPKEARPPKEQSMGSSTSTMS